MNEGQKFAFLAEIYDRSGVPCGMGILVAGDRVLTCAHVINLALGRNSDDVNKPNEDARIDVRFLFRPGCTRKGLVLHWHPPNSGEAATDCALLALRTSVETEIQPALFVDPVVGMDVVLSRRSGEESPLDWIYGKMGEPTTGGLYQVNKSQEKSPAFIVPGCSGGPVLNSASGHVVGMVVWGNQQEFHGHIAPTQMLVRVCDLRRPPPKPGIPIWKLIAAAAVILALTAFSLYQYGIHRDQEQLKALAGDADNSEHAKTYQLSESDIAIVDNALASDSHDQRQRALRVASSYEDVKLRHKDRIGRHLLSLLDQNRSNRSSNKLVTSDLIKVMNVLFALEYSDATATLFEIIHDSSVDQTVRLRALEGLPQVLPAQIADDTLNRICEHMPENRSSNAALYEKQLLVCYKYNPVRGLREVESLVQIGRAEDVNTLMHFFQAVQARDKADSPFNYVLYDRSGVLNAHLKTLGALIRKGHLKFDFAPELWNQQEKDARVPKVNLNAEIAQLGNGFVLSQDELESTVFILAASAAVKDLKDSEVDGFHRTVLNPINQLGRLQFEHEKAIGRLGKDASPMRWQGAFVLDWVTNDPFEAGDLNVKSADVVDIRVAPYDYHVNEGSLDMSVTFKESGSLRSKIVAVPLAVVSKGILHWKFRHQRENPPDI